jgi:hypothetical protein
MNGIEQAMFGTLPKDADAGGGRRAMNVARAMAAARTLGGQGYKCFPCRQNKRPSTPNGFKAAETDSEAIGALWHRYPGELVGVATGAMSGVSVLDIDAKHNTARKWWAEHRERLLPSRVHRTRSGGLHVLYRHRTGLTCSVSQIAHGVDVRADGGYVIWWPAAGQPVLADVGVKPWPEWLVISAPAPAAPAALPPSRRALAVRDLRPTLHRVRGIIGKVARAGEGERNRILFWATCRARDMVIAGELDHAAGVETIEALRTAGAMAGLHHREIERTISSAMRRRS